MKLPHKEEEMLSSIKYVDPKTVLSPKVSVSELRVVFDGGVSETDKPWSGWSLATLLWDGAPAAACRWNGEGEWIGTPSSRGLPTWFILPGPLAKLALGCVENHLNGVDQEAAVSVRSRFLDLVTFLRSASDEDLDAMIGLAGLRPAKPTGPTNQAV
jgi:hypothetical protein